MENNSGFAIELLRQFNQLPRYSYPFKQNLSSIPTNGIYLKFEKGEKLGDLDRIVRIGTDTGDNQLHSRLFQHFENQNQRRSIFRKNIGRCFLCKENNPYLSKWELDITSKVDKEKNLGSIDLEFEKLIEEKISQYIQKNFSFCVFQVNNKKDRLFWEGKIIATIAQSGVKPSLNWLGNFSTKPKIRDYGLWQVQGVDKQPLNTDEYQSLKKLILG